MIDLFKKNYEYFQLSNTRFVKVYKHFYFLSDSKLKAPYLQKNINVRKIYAISTCKTK